MKILMADDDKDDRILVKLAIQDAKLPHLIDFVSDGQELMEYLNAIPANKNLPDLLLLDLNMPRKDGREALKEIKENSRFKNIVVMILSTSDSEVDKHYTLGIGASMYIVKPSNFTELTMLIKNICERVETSELKLVQ